LYQQNGREFSCKGDPIVPTKRFKPEQIVNLLGEIEVEIANGKKAAQAAREVGICEQTYYLYGQLPVLQEES
jgi:hypothetical protein